MSVRLVPAVREEIEEREEREASAATIAVPAMTVGRETTVGRVGRVANPTKKGSSDWNSLFIVDMVGLFYDDFEGFFIVCNDVETRR